MSHDTITIDNIDLSDIITSDITINSTISGTGLSGSYMTSAGTNGTSWTTYSNTAPSYYSIGSIGSVGSGGLHVTSDAQFEGDIKIKGRSLEKLLTRIEDRLAILEEPDPKKLEKFAALKKAYEHYKTLERLIGDDYKDPATDS